MVVKIGDPFVGWKELDESTDVDMETRIVCPRLRKFFSIAFTGIAALVKQLLHLH